VLDFTCLHALGARRDREFYVQALLYAQSLWLQGLPAQAILLVNRALGADVRAGDPVLQNWPLPYRAMRWLLENRTAGQFIGNPRRHWQHLATRMVEPRKELRTWRAWACWWMARTLFPGLPADEHQLAEENVREPEEHEIFAQLTALGHPGEAALWRETWQEAPSHTTLQL
jgi:hypothetical protein